MKIFKKENWIFEFNNEWGQIFGKYNWYSFTFWHLYFENETHSGGVELHFMLLGLGFYLRYNYNFEESEVGKNIREYLKEQENENNRD